MKVTQKSAKAIAHQIWEGFRTHLFDPANDDESVTLHPDTIGTVMDELGVSQYEAMQMLKKVAMDLTPSNVQIAKAVVDRIKSM